MKKTTNTRTSGNSPLNDRLAILLREELKSRKLSELLHQLGVEKCPWLPSLNEPIAECLGLNSDEAFLEYDKVIDGSVKMLNNSGDLGETVRQIIGKLPHHHNL
jgi:hypothetical protein